MVAPVLDLNGADPGANNAAIYTENGTRIDLAPNAVVTDADDTNLESAVVKITSGFQVLHDFLSINGTSVGNVGAISFQYSGFTGELTLTGTATVAAYQAVLRLIKYETDLDDPGSTRTITWTVNDGDGDSAGVTTTVTTPNINDAPFGVDGGTTINEDAPYTLTTADFAFTDPDNDNLLEVRINSVTGGTLSVNGVDVGAFPATVTVAQLNANQVVFTPTANLNGADAASISFQVRDDGGTANGGSDTDPSANFFTFDINSIEDPATAQNDAFVTNEATAIGGGLNLFNDNGSGADNDPDGGGFSVTAVNGVGASVGSQIALASGALLTVNANGTFSYDPNGAFDATPTAGSGASNTPDSDSFTYTVTGGDTATVTLSISGLDSDDTLRGTAGADALNGGIGNDSINGLADADDMTGGTGDDIFFVDNAGDVLHELSGEGTDLVRSTIAFTLGNFIENLTLDGSADINGTGNGLDNIIFGTSGDNLLNGLVGADTLRGRGGDDTYIVDNIGDKAIELAGEGTDTVQSSVALTLLANVENLNLTGAASINGAGNASNNVLTGNSGANLLNGLGGADTMNGGTGNDTYIVDNAGDLVTEAAAAGTDKVQSSVTFTLGTNIENLTLTGASAINGTGNALLNSINGNGAANTLNGAAGADTMRGGGGNDTYIVDNVGDIALETSGAGGTDTVQSSVSFTLIAFLENLTLTGAAAINAAGNTQANILTGNSGANLLNGAAGADTMTGGDGNDTYVVDNAGDQAVEASAAGGTDIVQSAVDFTLGANVENLTLTGSADIDGTGNGLANTINGNSGDNVLNGVGGADTMRGGNGDDNYIVDNVGDVVTESSATGGNDRVQSLISFTLGNNVENLKIIGAAAVDGTGNALANSLVGNAAANQLNGLAGSDTLEGGAGADGFRFTTALGATNVDRILDFTVVDDTIFIDNAVFTGLAAGALAAGAFRNGTAAVDADDRIIYNAATGALLFDVDGVGGTAAVQFATLDGAPVLTNADFQVI